MIKSTVSLNSPSNLTSSPTVFMKLCARKTDLKYQRKVKIKNKRNNLMKTHKLQKKKLALSIS